LKFKYLIIVFSVIIVIIVLITSLLPLIISGHGSAVTFKYITLPLIIFMAVLLICMSIFFFINYRLFSLLEREDWPALAYYLEQKIYVKGKYSDRYVRLLASSYMVISDFSAVLKLENKVLTAKPSLISKNVLIFGAAKVLNNDHHEAVLFFKNYLGKCGKNDKQWVHWFYGFSQLLNGNFRQAEPEFSSLSVTSDSILITGLSAYFLQNTIEKHSSDSKKCHEAAENGRERVKNALNDIENWQKEKEKMRAEIHIAIINKYINEAGKWIFNKDSANPPLYADLPVTNDNSGKHK